LIEYDDVEPIQECDADSFINDASDCSGKLIAFTDTCTADSFDTENVDCDGELIPITEVVPPEPTEKCDAESFDKNDSDCLGELVKIDEIITTPIPPIEQCTAQSFKTEDSACMGKLLYIGDSATTTTQTTPYQPPVTPPHPKDLCGGEGSFRTVYGQRCKKNGDGQSSCTMGSEGFSFCDTEHMWWRDNHWYDWDLCSLCSEGKGPLTTSGYECKGVCENSWNNDESNAPRCEVANGGKGAPLMDYCTTCQGEHCPTEFTNPSDKRPGNQVGNIEWEVSQVE